MAKKGGVQQLQADIASDDDFMKFLERPGLLVLDVYSEWCGPCVGMVGSLRKIKLEVGGDNLQLAVCKSDTISWLQRFHRKSEPTWLFVANGKAVNILFGTDVPKLMAMIVTELDKTLAKADRITYEITELQPIELEQLSVKTESTKRVEEIELKEKEKDRLTYLNFVTETIMENMTDMGISVFGPQVNRDMFKKLSEPAEQLKMQCKDRKVLAVTKDDFLTINYDCENPLSAEVINYLHDKELLMCLWKIDETLGDVPTVLTMYADILTKKPDLSPEESSEVEQIATAIISPLCLEIEVKIEEPANNEEIGDEADGTVKEDNGKKFRTIEIPPIWVPSNRRTHASLIYVFFRTQTTGFLPPDPEPIPPHIIMSFDAYKKKDLVVLAEKFKEDIPLYGFFTSDNPTVATLIANSVEKYNMKTSVPTDKMILKVNKTDTISKLLSYGPNYVSPNTVVGKQEALQFFPNTFVSASEEQTILESSESTKSKKKKKNKKAVDPQKVDNEAATDVQNDEEKIAAAADPEESGISTSSEEDSVESRPPSAETHEESAVLAEEKTPAEVATA